MTEDETAERDLLALANERGKFGVEVGYPLDERRQEALERLQERDWIRLIDVSTTAVSQGKVLRLFLLTKAALDWLKKTAS